MERIRVGMLVLFTLILAVTVFIAVNVVSAQDRPDGTALSPEASLSEARLSVHTLVREDIFAGFMDNDMKRFARGEKNIALLMEQRPAQKANLLAWKGGASLYRAVRAYEGHRSKEYTRHYQEALDLFSQAGKLKTGNDGVAAIAGGSFVIFADRLPKTERAAAWKQAYDAYQSIWKQQSAAIPSLPVHFRGEVLGGLVKSAERTGHTQEANQYLDKMLLLVRDTPYETPAKQWKENPGAASNSSITCLSCHDSGRLADRVSALNKK